MFKNSALVLTALTCQASAASFTTTTIAQDMSLTFDNYLLRHDKTYSSSTEYEQRRQLFLATKSSVIMQNKAYAAGHSTWFAEVNEFADRTDTELSMQRIKRPIDRDVLLRKPTVVDVSATKKKTNKNPSSKSWIKYQSPVKNQGGCGSCWAFATTEVVESYMSIAENGTTPTILAPQTLVSCMKNPNSCGGTGGCEGAIAGESAHKSFFRESTCVRNCSLFSSPSSSPLPFSFFLSSSTLYFRTWI